MLSLEHTLLVLPGILVGFTVHEFAHAWVALRLGDDTAQQMGRFSLNPIRHIDLIGFILLLTAGFGWAKPVMIDHSKLRRPRRDDVLIAVAGPFSNLALSIAGTALLALLIAVLPYRGNQLLTWGLQALNAGIFVNLGLFVFNLIPIPPLDGSHVALQALNIRNPVNVTGVLQVRDHPSPGHHRRGAGAERRHPPHRVGGSVPGERSSGTVRTRRLTGGT